MFAHKSGWSQMAGAALWADYEKLILLCDRNFGWTTTQSLSLRLEAVFVDSEAFDF